jgi:pyruvate kinase
MLRIINEGGVLLREWDRQPLKTKIVATIGGPTSYKKGIYDLDLKKQMGPISYDYLLRNFIDNGVSLIRLNMAHTSVRQATELFQALRRQLGKMKPENLPRIAVLTDLPGPRIEFAKTPDAGIRLSKKSTKVFTICLDELVPGDAKHVSVCIGQRSLREYDEKALHHIMEQIDAKISKGEEVRVMVGDGKAILRVIPDRFKKSSARGMIDCELVKEGTIGRDRFTLKNIVLPIASFTNEDQDVLDSLFKCGAFQDDGLWAFVGLSFTQSADDVLRAKRFIETRIGARMRKDRNPSWYGPALVAKIETSQGYDRRYDIVTVVDAIMVARGDLGIQKDIEEVGTVEKELIKLCNKEGKPVITATQMLLSMTESLEPTRAEVTDVFNSILDGTDAVMLSEETSIGTYPFHAVRKMATIAAEAERFREEAQLSSGMVSIAASVGNSCGKAQQLEQTERRKIALQRYREFLRDAEARICESESRIGARLAELTAKISRLRSKGTLKTQDQSKLEELKWQREFYQTKQAQTRKQPTTDSTSQSTCVMSENEGIKAIVALTTTGRTAAMISRFRPTLRIVGVAHDAHNACKLLLCHGVTPINIGDVPLDAGPGRMFRKAARALAKRGLLQPEDGCVLTCGNRPKEPGTTNTIQIQEELRSIL